MIRICDGWLRVLSVVLFSCAVFLRPGTARAYCRATTCDAAQATCDRDAHDCLLDGAPLYWPLGTLILDVDSKGSPFRGITKEQLEKATTDAVGAWASAKCPRGGHPALHASITLVDGESAGYVAAGPNENVVIMHDENWPYEANGLGKTSLTFGLDSGEIFDADVELNSQDFPYSVDGHAGDVDLLAVLTHEIGHVFGLDHSDVRGATMQPETKGFATIDIRTLEPDDVAGICAIYPPAAREQANSSAPGTGAGGGCAVHGRRRPVPVVETWLLVLILSWRRRRVTRSFWPRRSGRQGSCNTSGERPCLRLEGGPLPTRRSSS